MNLTGLHFILTYRCTYDCDHCFVWSSPEAEGVLTWREIKTALDQAKETGTVKTIFFEGGEPFMYYPLLLEGVRYARKLGFKVGIVTNSYFATSEEDAEIWLKPFADLGISLSVSEDVFHCGDEYDQTSPGYAHQAAAKLNINAGTICIEPPKKIASEHEKGEPIIGGGVRFRGRAIEKLLDDKLPTKSWDTFDECPDEDFKDISRLHLDPYGNLYPCQGVVVGNLKKNTLIEVTENYDPANHPIITPLIKGGPAELVRQHYLNLKGRYLDACHLCYMARKELRQRYPEHLGPAQVYGE